MSLSQEIALGLWGVRQILSGADDSAQQVRPDPDAVWRAFIAVLISLPLAGVLGMTSWDLVDPNGVLDPVLYLAIVLVGHVLAWFGYALLSMNLATALGLQSVWPRYIVLWNWLNLLQFIVLLAGVLPDLLGAPSLFGRAVSIAVIITVLTMSWKIARAGLGISGGQAMLFVGLELLVSLFVSGVTQSLFQAAVAAAASGSSS